MMLIGLIIAGLVGLVIGLSVKGSNNSKTTTDSNNSQTPEVKQPEVQLPESVTELNKLNNFMELRALESFTLTKAQNLSNKYYDLLRKATDEHSVMVSLRHKNSGKAFKIIMQGWDLLEKLDDYKNTLELIAENKSLKAENKQLKTKLNNTTTEEPNRWELLLQAIQNGDIEL